ncbi:major facilitator superfamily domain-containing protein [Xylogone sp. PMI_703]|nr:major facilitator superfamily domain-containing protein [Xylogone sp. PMI_703]
MSSVEKKAEPVEHDEIVSKDVSEGSLEAQVTVGEEKGALKLDQHGYALVPQPTHFKDDPLNWPRSLKWLVLLQVSFLAMLGPFNSAVVNPALVDLSKAFHITAQEASYQTTAVIVVVGVSPLLWGPLANIYGRRPIYLVSTLIGIIATFGTGLANTWATLIVARVFSGVGVGAAMALGAATVNDMFFLHEKGTKMGIWTVFLTNGAHFAPIIGGYLAQSAGYRWCYYLPSIVNATTFIVMIFALPETLFSRSPEILARHQERTYTQMLFSFRRNMLTDRKLHARDFIRPFEMLKYPSVSLTLLYYMVAFAYSSILPAVTIAALFTKTYHFKTGEIGLMLGLPLLIGSAVGEFFSGPFSDWVMLRYARRHGGVRKPEARLPASFASVLLCPIGIIIYGVTLQRHTHWIGPVMGLVVASFGLQLVTTVNYTYCSGDCYKPQSGEIGSLYNFARQVFAFPLGFYALPLANKVGIQDAWIIFSMLIVASFLPTLLLIFKGEEWRKKLGQPQFHKDI